MTKLIRLSKSCIGKEEKDAVIEVLDKEFLGMGSEVEKFEEALSDFFNRNVSCVSSGTAALQLALEACGVSRGDEVIVPSLTYVATFQAITATGAKPIPCEVDPLTLCIDIDYAKKLLSKKTIAIMPVHYSGGVGELGKLYEFASKSGIRVIEDAAHAFGTFYNGKKIGSFGDIACFSFDGIKNITSGEGGCVVTNDEKVINKVKDARLLGVINDTANRYKGERSWRFDVTSQGWRYHMSNIMAAIGQQQLLKFSQFANIRQKLASLYDKYFFNTPIKYINHDYHSVVPHIYVIFLPEEINRDKLKVDLEKVGIQTGIHYQPNHKLTYFKTTSALKKVETISKKILTLPLHPDLLEEDIKYIAESILRLISLNHEL